MPTKLSTIRARSHSQPSVHLNLAAINLNMNDSAILFAHKVQEDIQLWALRMVDKEHRGLTIWCGDVHRLSSAVGLARPYMSVGPIRVGSGQIDVQGLATRIQHRRHEQIAAQVKALVANRSCPGIILIRMMIQYRHPQQGPTEAFALGVQDLSPVGAKTAKHARIVGVVRVRARVGVKLGVHFWDIALVRSEYSAGDGSKLSPAAEQFCRALDGPGRIGIGCRRRRRKGGGVATNVGMAVCVSRHTHLTHDGHGGLDTVVLCPHSSLVAGPEKVHVAIGAHRGGSVEGHHFMEQRHLFGNRTLEYGPVSGILVMVKESVRGVGQFRVSRDGGILPKIPHNSGNVSTPDIFAQDVGEPSASVVVGQVQDSCVDSLPTGDDRGGVRRGVLDHVATLGGLEEEVAAVPILLQANICDKRVNVCQGLDVMLFAQSLDEFAPRGIQRAVGFPVPPETGDVHLAVRSWLDVGSRPRTG